MSGVDTQYHGQRKVKNLYRRSMEPDSSKQRTGTEHTSSMMLRAFLAGTGIGRVFGSDLLFHDNHSGPKIDPLTLCNYETNQTMSKAEENRVRARRGYRERRD
jgi:hypothetical protein